MDRTHLIALIKALWLRLTVLVFAVSWAVRGYQVVDGIWIWAMVGWVGMWAGMKWWKLRKIQKERKDERLRSG